ncbi:MAG: hypothetical protein KDC54_24405 [Lewinella sp.]|nr:hypothetical protein [Lewinella sp.]
MDSIILEIVKIAFPALIVAFTIYFVLREQFAQQARLRQLEKQREYKQASLPVRLQAYERLSLLCERLAIPSLLLRIRNEEMNAATLRISLMLAIQQEFEHNITQQVYVSDQLWAIIQATRDDALQFLDIVSEKVDKKATGAQFSEALLHFHAQREADPIATAQSAIRKEASGLF